MKKISLSVLALLCFSILMTSCKKETVSPTTNTSNDPKSLAREVGISVAPGGYLVFSNEELYENTLHTLAEMNDDQLAAWEADYEFSSLRNTLIDNPEYSNGNTSIEDDLLKTIINNDGMIQIEGFVFKASLDENYVLAMAAADNEDYLDEMVNGEFVSSVMNKINPNDESIEDIFEFLKAGNVGYESPAGKTTNIFHDKSDHSEYRLHTSGVTYKAFGKNVYQKAAFYFSIMTEFQYSKKLAANNSYSNTNTNYIGLLVTIGSYKVKKKNASYWTNWTTSKSASDKLTKRFYEGSRGLDWWNLETKYTFFSMPDNANRSIIIPLIKN